VLQAARAPKRNHGHPQRRADLGQQRDIVALHRSIAIDRLQDDFADPQPRDPLRHFQRRAGHVLASSAAAHHRAAQPVAPDVDAGGDRRRTELPDRVFDESRGIVHRGRQHHLFRAHRQQRGDLLQAAHAPADGKRHVGLRGDVAQQAEVDGAPGIARADVEDDELVHPEVVEDADCIHRIAQVDPLLEADGLQGVPSIDQQHRNHARPIHARGP
jgi:hypothetical protein